MRTITTKANVALPSPEKAFDSPLYVGNERAVKAPLRRGVLPVTERFGVTVPVAATYIGISKSRIYELLKAGDLEGRIIHGRRIVVVESLLRMLGEAPSAKRGAA